MLRHPFLAGVLTLVLAVFSFAAPIPTHAEAYTSNASNYLGEELMRLTNLDRVSLGKPALKADKFLIGLASDMATTCPSNSTLVVRGRSEDMLNRSYLSHAILSCKNADGSDCNAFSMADRLGYTAWSSMGENIGSTNWGVDPATYTYGCDVTGANCKGTTAKVVPQVVSVLELGFMKSSGHRSNIMGAWTRFGCAAWTKPYSTTSFSDKKFTCIFASGSSLPASTLDAAGPAFSSVMGNGLTYTAGTSVVFTAYATDALSRLSDGNVTLDGTSNLTTGATTGRKLKMWAYDHTGLTASLSVGLNTTGLAAGAHTITWLVRDTAMNQSSTTITFYVR